jgi:hypothetical protein
MNQKVKQQRKNIPKYFWLFNPLKKVDIGSFIKGRMYLVPYVRIRIRLKRYRSVRIRIRNTARIKQTCANVLINFTGDILKRLGLLLVKLFLIFLVSCKRYLNFFLLGITTFRLFSIENISFFHYNLKIRFVSFWFRYFLADFERSGSYFTFVHSEERIKQNISFRYRNELKIRSENELVLCTLPSLVIT